MACDTALGMSRYQAEWERMRSRRNRIFLLLVAEFFALPLVGIAVISVERKLFSSAHAVVAGEYHLGSVVSSDRPPFARIFMPKVWQEFLRQDRRPTKFLEPQMRLLWGEARFVKAIPEKCHR